MVPKMKSRSPILIFDPRILFLLSSQEKDNLDRPKPNLTVLYKLTLYNSFDLNRRIDQRTNE